jgi:hypothetical protein
VLRNASARLVARELKAVARALRTAAELERCTLDDLTPLRYTDLRRRRPGIGLPRTTTLTTLCGSWESAIEAARLPATDLTREAAA